MADEQIQPVKWWKNPTVINAATFLNGIILLSVGTALQFGVGYGLMVAGSLTCLGAFFGGK